MKIGIVGAGQVGATAAYAMMMRGVGSESSSLIRTQIWRWLRRATSWTPPRLLRTLSGSGPGSWRIQGRACYRACRWSQPEAGRKPIGLAVANAEIFAKIVPAVLAAVADPIFLVATNPLDVMTQIVTVLAGRHGVAPERVIGSGTILDSARFCTALAAHLGVNPAYIDARVLGEHGDSQVLHWSGAVAGNLPVAEAARQMGRELTDRPQPHRRCGASAPPTP